MLRFRHWLRVALAVATLGIVTTLLPAVEAAPLAAETACLPGDPYNLAQLRTLLSSDTPFSVPQTINANLIVTFKSSVTLTGTTDDPDEIDNGAIDGPTPTEPDFDATNIGTQTIRMVNTRTRFEYEVSASQTMLKDIYNCHNAAGLTGPNNVKAGSSVDQLIRTFLPISMLQSFLDPSSLIPQSIRGTTDTRVLRSPTDVWPWRTIPQHSGLGSDVTSDCTSTMIGPRHLISAAQCINAQFTNNFFTPNMSPARDGINTFPYQPATATNNPATSEESFLWTPPGWRDPNDGSRQWDIGWIVSLERRGSETGWMGYGTLSGTSLQSRSILNRGYPRCSAAGPPGCENSRMYGDTNFCTIGNFGSVDPSGWSRRFTHSCDTNGGHSGSAMYTYLTPGPYVIAVHNTGGTSGTSFPNGATRLTPAYSQLTSLIREIYP